MTKAVWKSSKKILLFGLWLCLLLRSLRHCGREVSGCTSPDQPSSPTISSQPLQTQLREGSLSVPALSDLHHHHHHQAPKTRTLRSVLPTMQCVQLQAAVRLYCLQAGMACHLLISSWPPVEWWVILKSEGGVGKYNKYYLRNVNQFSRMERRCHRWWWIAMLENVVDCCLKRYAGRAVSIQADFPRLSIPSLCWRISRPGEKLWKKARLLIAVSGSRAMPQTNLLPQQLFAPTMTKHSAASPVGRPSHHRSLIWFFLLRVSVQWQSVEQGNTIKVSGFNP